MNFSSTTYAGTGQQTEIVLDAGEEYKFVIEAGNSDVYHVEFKFTNGSSRIIHPNYNYINGNAVGLAYSVYSIALNILTNVSGAINFEISKNYTR